MQTSNAAEAGARSRRRRHGGPFPPTGLTAMVETMTPGRFPAPWSAEKIAGGYVETANIVLRERGGDRRSESRNKTCCNEMWRNAQPKHHAAVKAELRREAGVSAKR
jgi:hypothetical protein